MADTNAESTNKLPMILPGSSLQPSVLDVVVRSTPTAAELSKRLMVLTLLFHRLLNEMMSGDLRYLAAMNAIDDASEFMDEEEAKKIVIEFMNTRKKNIMDSMF